MAVKPVKPDERQTHQMFKNYGDTMVILHGRRSLREGEIELDEGCFGAKRVRGIRRHGVRGKTLVYQDVSCFPKPLKQHDPEFKFSQLKAENATSTDL